MATDPHPVPKGPRTVHNGSLRKYSVRLGWVDSCRLAESCISNPCRTEYGQFRSFRRFLLRITGQKLFFVNNEHAWPTATSKWFQIHIYFPNLKLYLYRKVGFIWIIDNCDGKHEGAPQYKSSGQGEFLLCPRIHNNIWSLDTSFSNLSTASWALLTFDGCGRPSHTYSGLCLLCNAFHLVYNRPNSHTTDISAPGHGEGYGSCSHWSSPYHISSHLQKW